MKLTTYELVLCALCAAVTCILAPISVPLAGEVPISLATFAVLLSGILLGGRFGAISQLVYVLLGSVGVPVFAGWTGEMHPAPANMQLCSFQWSRQPQHSTFLVQRGSWP